MSRAGWTYAVIGLVALLFTWLNRGEMLVLHLGVLTWYRAPVAPVILAAFLFGMAAMVLIAAASERTQR